MLYARIENDVVVDWPLGKPELKKYFPQTSLPSDDNLLLQVLATKGIVPVKYKAPDILPGWDEKHIVEPPVKNKATGEWERKYSLVKLKGAALKNRAVAFLRGTDWIEVKYLREVVRDNTMTDKEFKEKYAVTLAKRAEAIALL